MKIEIAQYKSTFTNLVSMFDFEPEDKEWIRVSKFVEVEFIDIDEKELLDIKIDSLSEQIEKEKNSLYDLEQELNVLRQY